MTNKCDAKYAALLEAAREVAAGTRYRSDGMFVQLARQVIELEDEPILSEQDDV